MNFKNKIIVALFGMLFAMAGFVMAYEHSPNKISAFMFVVIYNTGSLVELLLIHQASKRGIVYKVSLFVSVVLILMMSISSWLMNIDPIFYMIASFTLLAIGITITTYAMSVGKE